jgi:multidrug efflux system outer membrane protein
MKAAMLPARALGLLTGLALVSGCSVGPDYMRPDVGAPASHRGVEGPPAEASLADIPWWEAVSGDPILAELIKEAILKNQDLRVAAARVEEYRALAGVARADYYPWLGAGAGASRQKQPVAGVPGVPTYNAFGVNATVSWEIDLWGRIRRSNESALNQLLATAEARRGVHLSLVTGVARSYLELRELDMELEIAERTRESRKASLELVNKRLLGGISNRLESSQAESALAQTDAVIPQLKLAIFAKENELALLLGRLPGSIPRGRHLGDGPIPTVPPGLPSALLERRPDVKQAEYALMAANAQVGVATALLFPQLSLTGSAGYGSAELSDLLKADSLLWNLAAGLTAPIFQGGRLRRNVEANQARWEQAKAQYEKAAIAAFGDAANALEAYRRTQEEREAQERNVAALRQAEKTAMARYDGGVSAYLEVLDSQRALFSGETALAQIIRDQYLSGVQVYKALGGGWNQPDLPSEKPAVEGARAK